MDLTDAADETEAATAMDAATDAASSRAQLEKRALFESWMELALDEAGQSLEHGDVPVGAVVVRDPFGDPEVIAQRHNERELTSDPTAHAELLALRDAAAVLGRWRLDDCLLVVTLEPCPMCAGALWASRIGGVVFGAVDMKAGATGSLYNLGSDARLNHEYSVTAGVLGDRCAAQLSSFFAELRA